MVFTLYSHLDEVILYTFFIYIFNRFIYYHLIPLFLFILSFWLNVFFCGYQKESKIRFEGVPKKFHMETVES